MVDRITDHADRAAARLAEQYKGTTVESLVRLQAGRTQGLEDVIHALISGRSVFTATGATLDLIGKMVGRPRPYAWDEIVYDSAADWSAGTLSRLVGTAGTLTVGGSSATFGRASVAYWNGTAYIAGQPRFVDPSNSGIQGVLIEEGSANLVASPHNLTGTGWVVVGTATTATANAGLGPNGVMEATRLQITAATGGDRRASVALTAGQVNTVSVRLKNYTPGNGSKVRVILADSTGAQVATSNTIIVTDSYVRVTISGTPANAGTGTVRVGSTATADAADVLVWGVQSENKAYATSEVTGTRAAETLTIPTAGLLAPSQGSVIIKAYFDAATTARILLSTRDASGNNGLQVYSSGGLLRALFRNATTQTEVSGAVPATGWHTIGVAQGVNLNLWADGALKASGANVSAPSTQGANAYMGSNHSGAFQWNNPFAFFYYYNRELSAAEMAAATAGNPPPDFTAYHDFTQGTLTYRASGSWVSPWKVNQTDVASKIETIAQTIPAGATITVEHRVNDYPQEAGASAWGAIASLPNKPYLQTRILMDGYAGAVQVQRLALTPAKPVPYDEAYRGQVLGQIVVNTSSGRSEDLIGLLRTLGADEARLRELRAATAVVQYSGTLAADDSAVKTMAEAATPPIEIAIDQYGPNYFGWAGDPNASGFGVGEFARRL
jgi:hypothetical protein